MNLNKHHILESHEFDQHSEVARIVTPWRRFSCGLWRVPEGDISDAYSADTMPRVKGFTHEGRLYTNSGGFSKWLHAEVNAYPLIHPDEYRGRDPAPYSYEGKMVTCKGKSFRLGYKTIFVASDPTVEEWRYQCRVLYADGGYFASGCTYTEFVGNRFDPQSANGREARFKELVECGALAMPCTQGEMCRWLAQETNETNQPQQIDFAL
jgi:hypothetical protein